MLHLVRCISLVPEIWLLFSNNNVTFDRPRKISGPSSVIWFLSRYTAVASIGISLGTEVRFLSPHWMMFTFQD